MKKSEKIKNGEGESSGKKRGKETKVSVAFLICKVLRFLIKQLFLLFFKVVTLKTWNSLKICLLYFSWC